LKNCCISVCAEQVSFPNRINIILEGLKQIHLIEEL